MKAKNERRKQYIGSQIDDCKDLSGIFYVLPFQKVREYKITYLPVLNYLCPSRHFTLHQFFQLLGS